MPPPACAARRGRWRRPARWYRRTPSPLGAAAEQLFVHRTARLPGRRQGLAVLLGSEPRHERVEALHARATACASVIFEGLAANLVHAGALLHRADARSLEQLFVDGK